VQQCIVYLVRNSLEFVAWKEYDAVIGMLKHSERAETAEVAGERLAEFAASEWGQQSATIAPRWRRPWRQVIPFRAYPQAVRKGIDMTHTLESVPMRRRKLRQHHGHFLPEEAAWKRLDRVLGTSTASGPLDAETWGACSTGSGGSREALLLTPRI
jgi:putative transposase